MLYGNIAVVDQMPVSVEEVLDAFDPASTRPPERAPDRPSSTR